MRMIGYLTKNNRIKEVAIKEVMKVIEVDRTYKYPGIPEFIMYGYRVYPIIEKNSEHGYCIILKNGNAILTSKIKGGYKND